LHGRGTISAALVTCPQAAVLAHPPAEGGAPRLDGAAMPLSGAQLDEARALEGRLDDEGNGGEVLIQLRNSELAVGPCPPARDAAHRVDGAAMVAARDKLDEVRLALHGAGRRILLRFSVPELAQRGTPPAICPAGGGEPAGVGGAEGKGNELEALDR